MKLKLLAIAVAAGFATAPVLAADKQALELQLKQLKADQAKLAKKVAALKSSGGDSQKWVNAGEVGGGLIADQSSRFGRDLNMLKLLKEAGKDAPALTVGGALEADIVYGRDTRAVDSGIAGDGIYNSNGYVDGQNVSSIYLDTARLDFLAKLNEWALVDWQIDIKSSGAKLRTGFVTFGNLNKTPFYASIGKIVPYFGDFGGHHYNNPLSTDYFRISSGTAAATLGFFDKGLNVTASVFKNDRGTSDNHLNNWALQGNYSFKAGELKAKIGAGYVHDLTGHALNVSNKMTAVDSKDPLPAANISAKIAMGAFSAKVNYAQTLKDVAHANASDNSKVSAYNAQLGYYTDLMNKPVDFSVSYSATKNVDGIGAGGEFKNQILIGAGVSAMEHLYVSLEYGNIAQYDGLSSDTNRYSVLTLDFWMTF